MTDDPQAPSGAQMTIGEFSARTRISVRMLRHYDEHGVLAPASVDAASGYRRYAPSQVTDAVDLRNLRDVGLGVSAIGALLAARGTPTFERSLLLQRAVLVDEAAAATQRLHLIDSLLDHLKETTMSTIDVTLKSLPATRLATYRSVIPSYQAEGVLWDALMPALQAQGIAPTGTGGCIEHDQEYKESDVEESAFVEVAPGTAVAAPLVGLDVPARDVVVARVQGPYAEAIPQGHGSIAAFMTEHGLRPAWTADDPASHVFNLYLNDPSQAAPADYLTDVCVPVHR